MNKCISLALPRETGGKNAWRRETESCASREMTSPGACIPTTTADKTLSLVPRRKYTESCVSLRPFNACNSRRGDSGCSSPKNAVARNGRCAYARKLRFIHRHIYIQRATMNFDGSFFPRGAFGRNDADLHYAIYVRDLRARVRVVSRQIYLVGCARRKNTPFVFLFFFLFLSLSRPLFIFYYRFAIRGFSLYTDAMYFMHTYKCDCTRRKHELLRIKITNI